jgi:hypothetical protein
LQQIDVNGNQTVKERQRVETGRRVLGKLEIGHRPEQDRTRLITERFRFEILFKRFQRGECESLIRLQFRHHVVVIGVEPLRHFLRRCRCSVCAG